MDKTNKETKVLDKFELALEDEIKNLQECQISMSVKTCSDCDKLFDCAIRKKYVDAVYNSMSKGGGGGFEF